jgi:hypothetical protein
MAWSFRPWLRAASETESAKLSAKQLTPISLFSTSGPGDASVKVPDPRAPLDAGGFSASGKLSGAAVSEGTSNGTVAALSSRMRLCNPEREIATPKTL